MRFGIVAPVVIAALLVVGPVGIGWAEQVEREVPDYARREEPPPTVGEALLWVPRVVFYPVYLVTEYLVRWPLGTFLTWVEREHILDKTMRIFTLGTEGRAGIVPTVLIDFGFRPSVGLYFWANELYGPSDSLGVHFAFGGESWWRLSVRQRFQFGGSWEEEPEEGQPVVPLSGTPAGSERPDRELALHFLLDYRPDYLFYGLGPDAPDLPARFEDRALGGSVTYREHFLELSSLGLRLEVTRHELADGDADEGSGEVELSDAFAVEDPGAVPGFPSYVAGLARLNVDLDSRSPRPAPGTGVRLGAQGELGTDLSDTDVLFVRYGGALDLFVDLTGRQQVLALRQWVGLTEVLGDAPVPFPEQHVVGGGEETLRGLLEGRYRGLGGTVTSLSYSYPIWVFLDGYVFAEVGNAWGPHLEGFDVGKMAGSFGLGMRSNTARDNVFNLLLGLGTSPFYAPRFGVENFRIIFGTTTGF